MRSTSNAHSTALRIFRFFASTYKTTQIAESTCSVRVREHDVGSSGVSHAVRHSSSLSAVLLQIYDSDCSRWNPRGLQTRFPWSFWCWRCAIQLMCFRKLQCRRNSLVRTSVAHKQNLPSSPGVRLPAVRLCDFVAATLARRAVVSVLCFQIFHSFLQHTA